MKFKISGTLKYNSDPNPRIPLEGFTVILKSGASIIATTTTHAVTGYYEFYTTNGTYTLEASAPVTSSWYADIDDVTAINDYTGGYDGIPYLNALRLLAADVNQNGDVDIDDITDLNDRTGGYSNPDYTAPDWVFETPSITVSCSDVLNTDFMGLCSGNVLGSNPTPNE